MTPDEAYKDAEERIEAVRQNRATTLYLPEMGLTRIPEKIARLSQVRDINLRGNQITDIPVVIAQLSQLRWLNLDRNPLNPDLSAAYKQGLEAVREYLRAKAEGQIVLNEAKLILVGEGEVGKSCLLGALRGDEWVEDRPTTHGIEIKPIVVTAPDETTEITLNGWDFGGQQVYRPTHQLFFSPSAVYLVVWKPREGPQQGFVKEWITLIKHREPDAKILIVATHGGPGQRQPDIDRQELIDLFGSDTILGFHFIDSKTNKGIPELRTAISQVAATLPDIGRTVPTKWQKVRDILQTSPQPYESYADVMDLCAKQGMDAPQAKLFIQISHQLGLLTHYHYDTILRDIVILKPDWLAKAISYVFDDETTRQRSGLADFEHLSDIWHNPPFADETGYPKELHPVFLKLMEEFDLSYKVILDPVAKEPSTTSLIAQLVPDNRPEQLPDWGTEPTSGDRQQIQICSIVDERGQSANAEGLFYQLIVRLHKYSLGRENYNNSIHWQRGLMLDNDYNGRALLEHSGNDVRITVRAAYPERFLSYLTEEVKWLIESFWEGLKCNVMVPCIAPCGLDLPGHGLFEVQKLIESKKKNRPEFPCPISGCGEWQNIDQLLNNVPTTLPPSQDIGIEEFREVIKDELKFIRKDLSTLDRRDQQRHNATMSRIDQQFAYLMQTYLDEAKEGPRLFSFKPVNPDFCDKPKWLTAKFQLTLWCEHSRQPLPILNPDNPKKGVYELELNREWFTKATPYFKLLTGTLSLVLPVVASVTQFALDDATYASISEELNLGEKSLDFGMKASNLAIAQLEKQDSAEFTEGEAIRAKGAILRDLHRLLKEKDPSFGGLVRVQNKRREFLWVHEKFVSEY